MWNGYAVVDVETTGLNAKRHDRVIEIGVVQLDREGRVTEEWVTLVNPVRDLGPIRIHGIRAADVRQAPVFDQVAGTLASLLTGRMVVAHNLFFDAMFLAAEYARLGVEVPAVSGDNGLCTMRLAHEYLPSAARSLRACCRAVGVPLLEHHDALHDARAAAGLFAHFLAAAGTPTPWASLATQVAGLPWPPLPATTVTPVRRGHSTAVSPQDFLTRLVDRLPRSTESGVDSYLAVLDGALLDRHISASEADALVDVAGQLGLDRAAALAAHRSYLESLAVAAWEDGVVTQAEEADLRQVAGMLGLGGDDVAEALRLGRQALPSQDKTGPGRFNLKPADHVVFTGEMNEAREVWEERARAAGLVAGKNVTKKTVPVIAGDPDHLSGKARKARDYRIPIVSEDAFARMLRTPR
jgi:DNA polymerase-3 subunit epsilon